jgi:Holliday junction resolvase RusA-like endonuclease
MKTATRGYQSRIIIPDLPPSLNEVIDKTKTHWSGYSNLKKRWTATVCDIVGEPKRQHNMYSVKCWWYRTNRRADPDNIAHGIKYILDGLVKAGLLADDRWKNVKSIEHYFGVREDPRVEVQITEVA